DESRVRRCSELRSGVSAKAKKITLRGSGWRGTSRPEAGRWREGRNMARRVLRGLLRRIFLLAGLTLGLGLGRAPLAQAQRTAHAGGGHVGGGPRASVPSPGVRAPSPRISAPISRAGVSRPGMAARGVQVFPQGLRFRVASPLGRPIVHGRFFRFVPVFGINSFFWSCAPFWGWSYGCNQLPVYPSS